MEKLFTNLDLLNTIKSQTNLEKIPLEYLRNDLFEQKKKYEFATSNPETWAEIDEWEFVISLINIIDRKINIINNELSRLESEKTKDNPKGGNSGKSNENHILAFNNGGDDEDNVDDELEKIKLILDKINDLLFVNSTPKQWEQLLKGDVLEKPIVIKDTIAMEDFKYFIDSAKKVPAQIFGSGLYTGFEDNKAFFWNRNLLTRTKISNYYKRSDKNREAAGVITKIDEIFSTFI